MRLGNEVGIGNLGIKIGGWDLDFGFELRLGPRIGDGETRNRNEDWGLRFGSGSDWNSGVGYEVEWGFKEIIVYRLKIIFALDGYLIGCGDA